MIGTTTVFAVKPNPKSSSETPAVPYKKGNKLSDEELSRLTKRDEEIRGKDKTNMTSTEKRGLKKELRSNQEYERHHHVYYYSGAAVILIVILVLLLV